jgi:Secretion system C-terminal sorting domain/Pregnancy-associated plasma protein-A
MKNLICTLLLTILCVSTNAQSEKCATMKNFERRVAMDPSTLTRKQQSEIRTQKWLEANAQAEKVQQLITIPVVVHVLWHETVENISDAQIQSQIDILNEDFRLLNADSLDAFHPFWPYTADTEIEFCLASVDPNGNATTGITRTNTDSLTFIGEDNEKFTATGGKDNWDPTSYLNMWVCNLDGGGGLLGYAQFPADLATSPATDGVVIRYQSFGNMGTVEPPNVLGRTATHEVGHWLNLSHIWGDDVCGDDLVADTEIAEFENYECPSFPHNAISTCGSGELGEMYMNYMDYVDDNCMNMFTFGQAERMRAALNTDRIGLLSSSGCNELSNVGEAALENSIDIYPNPGNGNFTIEVTHLQSDDLSITIYDLVGSSIQTFKNINNFPFQMNLTELANGIYYVKINSGDKTITKKIIISK